MTVSLISVICYAICKCLDKWASLLTSTILELKSLTLKNEQYYFHQISDQPTLKKTTLLRSLHTGVYLDKISTGFVKLAYLTRWKVQLTKVLLIKCPHNTWLPSQKGINKLVEFAATMNSKIWY